MKNSPKLIRMIVMSLMIAMGVVISPILRVEGMCPMAHFINVVNAVLLGPWEALICAILIGIIRMITMGIPPLALTGAVFGAFLSGLMYRISKGKLLAAVLGEIVGTGIIGAIVSYPVMAVLWGREGLTWLFYVPSFIAGTFIGGTVAFAFLRKLAVNGLLENFQSRLGSEVYSSESGALGSSISVAAIGVIGYITVELLANFLDLGSAMFTYIARGALVFFVLAGAIKFLAEQIKTWRKSHEKTNIENL